MIFGFRKVKDVIASGYALGDQRIGVRFPITAEVFLLSTASRPTVGPTQFLIQ
jgi:hypothetical protein